MNNRMWGIILLSIGIILLLQVTGFFNFGLAFWPLLLVLLGGLIVWGSFLQRGCFWLMLVLGLWVGGIGLFQILNNAGVTNISAGDVARYGWPLLLIALGISILFGDRGSLLGSFGCKSQSDDDRLWSSFGKHRKNIGDKYQGKEPWVLDENIDILHGIGGVVLDLTTATISDGQHRVTVETKIGEVLIRVPNNVNVKVDASVFIGELEVMGDSRSGLGGLSLQRESLTSDSNVELNIKARLGIGELSVVLSPTSSGVVR